LGPPVGELGGAILRAEQAAGIDTFEGSGGFALDSGDEAQRAQRLRDAQEGDAAAKAQVFFPLAARNRERQGPRPDEVPSSALERALTLLPQNAISSTRAAMFEQNSSDANGQASKRTFAGESSDDEIYAQGELETPGSPYQLMAGTVISAALITGINSDLPGQIIATVTDNVYDTVSGSYLLVPQGSRLIGRYDSDVAFGQRRVLLVWTRLLRPDGSSITLDRLPGVDLAGYAGLTDRVDSKWSRLFAGAAASTLIGVGAELASPSRREDGSTVVLAARDSLQGSITDAGQQVTQRNLDVQPTLTIRAGFVFRVIINKDIALAPIPNDSVKRARS
jgi:type IV secretion system protein VirB10